LALGAALACVRLGAQGAAYVQDHYDKREAMVPMRDGVRLCTEIYTPRDRSRAYPILVERTPYGAGPYGPDGCREELGPSPRFAEEGFIFVVQDVRGRMMSEGTFVDLTPAGPPSQVDESTDAYDTVAWLVDHVPGHNGRVGLWGVSYPGFYAAAGLIGAHPAVRAVSPQAPIMDWFLGDDFHRNGALWLPHLFNFVAQFGRPRPGPTAQEPPPFRHGTRDGYAFFLRLGPLADADALHFKGAIPFWDQVMAHGTYDAFWKARDLRPHLRDVRPAVLAVGGWFDAENLFGSLQMYSALARQSPGTELRLVMGPWDHGGWHRGPGDELGDIRFGDSPSVFFQDAVELPFFLAHLKGAPDPGLPRAWTYDTGADRWRRFDAWPPPRVRTVDLYFQPRGRLGSEPPDGEGGDAYPSDPARPVPYFNGIAIGMVRNYMTADQRFAERRPDVLAYRTAPLEADLTLAGPIQADLWVSTTGTDSDWVVKVIDVHPDEEPGFGAGSVPPVPMGGYQQLVRGEAMRGKFRNSFERPEPFVPGQPAEVRFALDDVFHTFRKGHRLMVQVQSSWFPLMDRNPQVFTDIYRARPDQFRPATERLLRGPSTPSRLVLPVLP
jgi:putative CocE/NonD family hydrolase